MLVCIELGSMYNVSAAEVERKLANINSQYRRERRNYKKYNKSGAAPSFRPEWFGYNLMAFLRDKNKPRSTEESGFDENSLMEVNSDTSSEEETETVDSEESLISTAQDGLAKDEKELLVKSNMTQDPISLVLQQKKYKPDRKEKPAKKVQQSESAEILGTMRNIYQTRTTTPAVDEFHIFGELIATKVRNLKTPYARSTIQNEISNLFYEAETDTYDAPLSHNTFHSYPHVTTVGNNAQYSNPPSGSNNYWIPPIL